MSSEIIRHLWSRWGVICCNTCLAGVNILFFSTVLTACAAIVRPNYETEIGNLRPGNYTLDPQHAFVLFRVDHLGLSKVIGRFNDVAANLAFDPNDLAAMQLDGLIDTASIDLGDPEFESQLRGADWLASEQFPQARFTTAEVVVLDDGELQIQGELTLRGVSQAITLQARFNGGADNILTGKYTLGFSANTTVSRKAFGMDGFAALVGDAIDIEIEAEFQKQ